MTPSLAKILQKAAEADPKNAELACLLGKFLYEGKSSLPKSRAHVLARDVSLLKQLPAMHILIDGVYFKICSILSKQFVWAVPLVTTILV